MSRSWQSPLTKRHRNFWLALIISGCWFHQAAADQARLQFVEMELRLHSDPARAQNAPQQNCLPITRIAVKHPPVINYFHGQTVDLEQIRTEMEDYAYDCQSGHTLKGLLGLINKAYTDAGYITTQAYLPEQNIQTSRTVLIEVIPGRVDEIVYTETHEAKTIGQTLRALGDAPKNPGKIPQRVGDVFNSLDNRLDRFSLLSQRFRSGIAMPLKSGDVLHIEQLQQGLDQINRLGSSQAKARLEPGAAAVSSKIVIDNTVEDTFRFYIGYSEENPIELEDGEEGNLNLKGLTARLEKDNLIGINDRLSIALTSEFNTNELSGHFSFPWRWMTFSLDAEYSESLTQLIDRSELLQRSGSATLGLSYLALRTKTHRTTFSASLKRYASDRFVNALELAPQRFTVVRGGVDQVYYLPSMVITNGVGVSKGLDWFEATNDPSNPLDTEPRAQFVKLDGRLSVTKAFQRLGNISLSANGQWTATPLYSSEQLTLGSESSIRGFEKDSFAVDRGAYARTELLPRLPVDALFNQTDTKTTNWLGQRLKQLQPYAFIDAGYGEDIANSYEDFIIGGGGGLRYIDGRFNLSAGYHQGLYRQNLGKPDNPYIFFKAEFKVF